MPSRRMDRTMDLERRQELLATAAHEFAEAGYERASLNAIIRRCSMSKSSFYYYFSNKAELFDTVVREAAQALAADLVIPEAKDLAGSEFWEELTRLATDLLAVTSRADWYTDFGRVFYLADAPREHGGALQTVLSRIAGWLDEVLAVGRECGEVRSDLPRTLQAELAVAVLQAMDRWSLQHLGEIPHKDRAGAARAQIDAIRRMLAPNN